MCQAEQYLMLIQGQLVKTFFNLILNYYEQKNYFEFVRQKFHRRYLISSKKAKLLKQFY